MNPIILDLITRALQEDMPNGDITTDALFHDEQSTAVFLAKEDGILSGIDVAEAVFHLVDPTIKFIIFRENGDPLRKGDRIAVVSGKSSSLLKAERVGLNFLQRMSGIATLTNQFVQAIKGTKAQILDTRKTTPTLRILEKQAVRDGGGTNHRMSLSDMSMIKDNHIKAAGSITKAVELVRQKVGKEIRIEVEVESISEYREALATSADIIMLDNMPVVLMAEAVSIPHPGKKIEASGNMNLSRVNEVARTGVDYISVGALTHSFQSLDISLKFQ